MGHQAVSRFDTGQVSQGLVVGGGVSVHRHPLGDMLGWLAQIMTQAPAGGWWCQPAPELFTQPLEPPGCQIAISLSEPEQTRGLGVKERSLQMCLTPAADRTDFSVHGHFKDVRLVAAGGLLESNRTSWAPGP